MTVLFTELKYCHKPLGYEIAMSAFKFLIRKRLMTNFIFTSSNCVKLQVSHVHRWFVFCHNTLYQSLLSALHFESLMIWVKYSLQHQAYCSSFGNKWPLVLIPLSLDPLQSRLSFQPIHTLGCSAAHIVVLSSPFPPLCIASFHDRFQLLASLKHTAWIYSQPILWERSVAARHWTSKATRSSLAPRPLQVVRFMFFICGGSS